MANIDSVPEVPTLRPHQARLGLLTVLATLIVLCVAAVLLPHDKYVRYQQFASGHFARGRWVYERIHFDRTPIDVAIVGSSRIEAAVSAPLLQKALSGMLGRKIHVASVAVPLEGRDAHYVIARELLDAHPETRMVILSLVEPSRLSHPAFKYIADAQDVLGAPMWLNYYWLQNAGFLPYRNMSLFVQSRLPGLFGVSRDFDRQRYDVYGTDFDSTKTFRMENGLLINRERQESYDKLEWDRQHAGVPTPSRLARLTGADDNIIENHLTAALGKSLKDRCTALVLLHLPTYKGDLQHVDIERNARAGIVLMTPPEIGNTWTDFGDVGHLRRAGIDKVSAWLPGALAPYLGPMQSPRQCPEGSQAPIAPGSL